MIIMVIILCHICIVCSKAPTGKEHKYEVRWQSDVCCSYTSSYSNVSYCFSVFRYSSEHNQMVRGYLMQHLNDKYSSTFTPKKNQE